MATNGYPAHVSANFVTSLTTFMYELQDSLLSKNNVDDDGSTVRTRPPTTTINTVRRYGF